MSTVGRMHQMITNRLLGGSNYWMQMMAQKGYIVFTMDNRGSKNRGFEFESAIHAKVGDLELEDQLAGVNQYLKSLHYVDTTRMGVHGWRFWWIYDDKFNDSASRGLSSRW